MNLDETRRYNSRGFLKKTVVLHLIPPEHRTLNTQKAY